MTPDARRLHQIRENLVGRDDTSDDDVRALCDALEAAWAESENRRKAWENSARQAARQSYDIDDLRERAERAEADHAYAVDQWRAWRERAERAKAERESSLNELRAATRSHLYWREQEHEQRERAERAEAELAAQIVQDKALMAACERKDAALARVRALCAAAEERPYGHQLLCPAEIRAAVEGDSQ